MDVNQITIEDLTLREDNGKTVFENLIDNGTTIDPSPLLEYIASNYDYLKYMIEHKRCPEKFYNYDLLFDNSRGTPIINILYEKDPYKIQRLPVNVIKYMFEEHHGKYIMDDLVAISTSDLNFPISRLDDFELLYKYFSHINKIDLFKFANNNVLLHQLPNGKTLLDILIEADVSGVKIWMQKNDAQAAQILYNHGDTDNLLQFDIDILANYPSQDKNYIDLLIEKYRNGENINFNRMIYTNNQEKSLARILLTLVKNNITPKKPSDYELVGGEKPAIFYMLEEDYELTKNNFITDGVMNEIRSYFKKVYNINPDNLSLDELLTYLPTKEKLQEKLNNGLKHLRPSDYFSDDFMKPFGNETTFLEYAFKNNIIIYNTYVPKTIEEIKLYVKYRKKLPYGIKENLLYEKINDNELFIDYLMKNNIERTLRDAVKEDLRILDYCVKYNNFTSLNEKILDNLFASINGSYEALKYLNNDNFIKALSHYNIPKSIALDMIDKGYLKALQHSKEDILLEYYYDGKTILEHLLDNKINLTFGSVQIYDQRTINTLYKYRRPDLMRYANISLLVNYPSKRNNYLKYMIAAHKSGQKVQFELMNFFEGTNEEVARCYLQMGKNNLIGTMVSLDEETLLKETDDEKSILYYLVSIDAKTAVNKVISKNLLDNPKINAALKVLSRQGLTDLPIKKLSFNDICRNAMNKAYNHGIESPVEDLLNELKELFYNDNKSNKELIDTLVIGYRYATSINPIFIEELKTLIAVKKNNPKFHYELVSGKAYFDNTENIIVCDNTTISTILHETGHALHYYTTNEDIPENFFELIENVRNSPGWLNKVNEYAQEFARIRESVHKKATKIVEKGLKKELTDEENEEIDRLLGKEKESIIEDYTNKGYTREQLNAILSKPFTKKEFLAQKKEIEIREVEDFIIRYTYDGESSIGDFIDAISNGAFRSSMLYTSKGKLIPPAYGHGMRYYQLKEQKFNEMVANYCEMIKTKGASKALVQLRYIIGDELMDMLDKFYRERILNLREYQINDEGHTRGGK